MVSGWHALATVDVIVFVCASGVVVLTAAGARTKSKLPAIGVSILGAVACALAVWRFLSPAGPRVFGGSQALYDQWLGLTVAMLGSAGMVLGGVLALDDLREPAAADEHH
jgi:hypothetical protein